MKDIKLSEKLLEQLNACSDGIDFAKRNKLLGFPLSRLNEIEGDYNGSVKWVKSNTEIMEFDENDNVIHFKNPADASECWNEYDKNGNLLRHKKSHKIDSIEYVIWQEYDENDNEVYYKDSYNLKRWKEYDENNNMIHLNDSDGFEYWQEFDENNNMIHLNDSDEFEQWKEYDGNGNLIHLNDSDGFEQWKEYDGNGNLIHCKNSDDYEYWQEFDENGNLVYLKTSYGRTVHNIIEYYDDGQLKRFNGLKIPYFEK